MLTTKIDLNPLGQRRPNPLKKAIHTRFLAWGNPVNYIVCCLAKIKFDIFDILSTFLNFDLSRVL